MADNELLLRNLRLMTAGWTRHPATGQRIRLDELLYCATCRSPEGSPYARRCCSPDNLLTR